MTFCAPWFQWFSPGEVQQLFLLLNDLDIFFYPVKPCPALTLSLRSLSEFMAFLFGDLGQYVNLVVRTQ